jgi:hypothetical protein
LNIGEQQIQESTDFKPLRVAGIVLLILLVISVAAQWYATVVTLPRYCNEPVETLERVRQVLTERHPAGEGDRKPYIIAARLTFLVPQASDETVESYIERLQGFIDQQCR